MRVVSGTPYLTPGGLRGGQTPGDPEGTLQTIDISDVPFPLPLFPSSGVNRPGPRLRLGSARDASPGRGISSSGPPASGRVGPAACRERGSLAHLILSPLLR